LLNKWKKWNESSKYLKNKKRLKKLKRKDFPLIEDEKLLEDAIGWIAGKMTSAELSKNMELLATLPKPCQYVIAVNAVDGEVMNYSFAQYYFNESHILTVKADEALLAIGAPRLAKIVQQADIIYAQVKKKLGSCRKNSDKRFSDFCKNNPFAELDEEFFSVSYKEQIEPVEKLLISYIKQNIDCFGD